CRRAAEPWRRPWRTSSGPPSRPSRSWPTTPWSWSALALCWRSRGLPAAPCADSWRCSGYPWACCRPSTLQCAPTPRLLPRGACDTDYFSNFSNHLLDIRCFYPAILNSDCWTLAGFNKGNDGMIHTNTQKKNIFVKLYHFNIFMHLLHSGILRSCTSVIERNVILLLPSVVQKGR
ncbi:hypothetical protein FOCC_FOCC006758, partial [Frankliniella occidentalis]